MPRVRLGDDSTEYNDQGEFVPWGRMPEDTPRSFQVFCVFRDLGPGRKCSAAAKQLGVSTSAVRHLVTQHNMLARAHAWDVYQDKIYCEGLTQRTRAVAKAHLKAACFMRRKALRALNKMPIEALIAKPEAAIALLKEAVRIEAAQLHTEDKPSAPPSGADDTIYFDSLPTTKLIEAAEAGLKQLRQQQDRERALSHDNPTATPRAAE